MTAKEMQQKHEKAVYELQIFKTIIKDSNVRELRLIDRNEYEKLDLGKFVRLIPKYLRSTITGVREGFKDQEDMLAWLGIMQLEDGEYYLVFQYRYVKYGSDHGDNWYGVAVYQNEKIQ